MDRKYTWLLASTLDSWVNQEHVIGSYEIHDNFTERGQFDYDNIKKGK